MSKNKIAFVLWTAASLSSLAQASESKTYQVTDLGTLGGATSVACGLNDQRQVVGFSSLDDGQSHAFLWSEQQMIDLGTLPDLGFSEARNINCQSQVSLLMNFSNQTCCDDITPVAGNHF